MRKEPFDIEIALARIEEAVRPFPKAGLFELFDDGFGSPFEILVACLISIRTLDEVMLPTARQLFARARTPDAIANLTPETIDGLIHACTFHDAKARQIHAIARRCVEEFGGALPCDPETLLSFTGVGPKCANLVLGITCGQPRIAVDVHVHRIANRWGYVQTRAPEETMAALEAKVPRSDWITVNRLLVPFGKHICQGKLPRCSVCPVLNMCQQIGVTEHR
jgi:endonuclease-3